MDSKTVDRRTYLVGIMFASRTEGVGLHKLESEEDHFYDRMVGIADRLVKAIEKAEKKDEERDAKLEGGASTG